MRHRVYAKRALVAVLAVATIILMAIPALGGGRPLSAELNGANEVSPASTSVATGTAQLTLNQGQGEICVEIESGPYASDVLISHIHVGDAGTNGLPVVPMTTISSDGELNDCFDVAKDLIKQIRQNPQGYYINIHTVNNGPGAIRGQLSK